MEKMTEEQYVEWMISKQDKEREKNKEKSLNELICLKEQIQRDIEKISSGKPYPLLIADIQIKEAYLKEISDLIEEKTSNEKMENKEEWADFLIMIKKGGLPLNETKGKMSIEISSTDFGETYEYEIKINGKEYDIDIETLDKVKKYVIDNLDEIVVWALSQTNKNMETNAYQNGTNKTIKIKAGNLIVNINGNVGDIGEQCDNFIENIKAIIISQEKCEEKDNEEQEEKITTFYIKKDKKHDFEIQKINEEYSENKISSKLINILYLYADIIIEENEQDPFWSDSAKNILILLMLSNLVEKGILKEEQLKKQIEDDMITKTIIKNNLEKLSIPELGEIMSSKQILDEEKPFKSVMNIIGEALLPDMGRQYSREEIKELFDREMNENEKRKLDELKLNEEIIKSRPDSVAIVKYFEDIGVVWLLGPTPLGIDDYMCLIIEDEKMAKEEIRKMTEQILREMLEERGYEELYTQEELKELFYINMNENEKRKLIELGLEKEIAELNNSIYQIKYFEGMGYVLLRDDYVTMKDGTKKQHYYCKIFKDAETAKEEILKKIKE